jgi:cobalamin biosynthesis protein CobT
VDPDEEVPSNMTGEGSAVGAEEEEDDEEEEEESEEEGREEEEEEEEEGEEEGEDEGKEEGEDDALPAIVVHQEREDEEETASVLTEVSAATITEQNVEELGFIPLVATSVFAIVEASREISFKREVLENLGVSALNRVKRNVNERLTALAQD